MLHDPKLANSWIAIGKDNAATVYLGKVELGQGNSTSMLQLVAEELDIDLRVCVGSAGGHRAFDKSGRDGLQFVNSAGRATIAFSGGGASSGNVASSVGKAWNASERTERQ